MKLLSLITIIGSALTIMSCSKGSGSGNDLPLNNNSQNIRVLRFYAGPDTTITLPANEIILTGRYNMATNVSLHDITVKWTKISGPASGNIVHPNAWQTEVKNLEPGVYIFELTGKAPNFTVIGGRVTVTVKPEPPPLAGLEHVFQNLTWAYGMRYKVDIDDFYNRVPGLTRGMPFYVYIQSPPSMAWMYVENLEEITLPSGEYVYNFNENGQSGTTGGTLEVHYSGHAITDRLHVKIVY